MSTSSVNWKCQNLTAIYLYITLYIRVTGGERRRRESSTSLLDYQTEFAQVTIRRIQLSHFVDLSGIMMSQCVQVLPQRVALTSISWGSKLSAILVGAKLRSFRSIFTAGVSWGQGDPAGAVDTQKLKRAILNFVTLSYYVTTCLKE